MQNDQTPVYNIKAVSGLVGLPPVTLRAWERRYGLPCPQRGDQGYRYYSEHDLRILRWLKIQLESGLNIGQAVKNLNELQENGRDPSNALPEQNEVGRPTGIPAHTPSGSRSLAIMSHELLGHLLAYEDTSATELLRVAFALYSIDQILMEILTPALVQIGEQWHAGRLPIATEHFASQFCMQHLMSLLAAAAPAYHSGVIIAACAPGETHQIGLLMLVVRLRWHGWNVKYLGPDLKLEGLAEAINPIHPTLLLFSANRVENAERLGELPGVLKRFASPQPLVVLGGAAFQTLRLPASIPAVYLNAPPLETVKALEMLMEQQLSSTPLIQGKINVQK